ncbi:MAG: DUF3126 family protein [Xanthobacteraceae bacterium]|nr:DUF3126 family protein [Xanthobacteraceae bacterium]QYK43970.1 MAG: DUF3126 family protein [Xanthobacteraceae bacterium]HMN50550.1 DUF3126 family protein [Xanthobacteraceae bacterium]
MDRAELDRLQTYLQRMLNPEIGLAARARVQNMAELILNDEPIGRVTVDDEDGDRSYNVTVSIEMPSANPNLNEAVRGKFGNPKLRVVPRPKKTDSSEIYLEDEYIAVLFRDDASGRSWTFEMAVLDIDLDEAD